MNGVKGVGDRFEVQSADRKRSGFETIGDGVFPSFVINIDMNPKHDSRLPADFMPFVAENVEKYEATPDLSREELINWEKTIAEMSCARDLIKDRLDGERNPGNDNCVVAVVDKNNTVCYALEVKDSDPVKQTVEYERSTKVEPAWFSSDFAKILANKAHTNNPDFSVKAVGAEDYLKGQLESYNNSINTMEKFIDKCLTAHGKSPDAELYDLRVTGGAYKGLPHAVQEVLDKGDYERLGAFKSLTNMDFRDKNLSGAVLNKLCFDGSDFSGANLKDVVVTDCSMQRAAFEKTDMRESVFKNTDMRNSVFYSADCSGTKFENCPMVGCVANVTDFSGARIEAHLSDAALSTCDLRNVDFHKSVFGNTDMSYTDLRGAKFDVPILSTNFSVTETGKYNNYTTKINVNGSKMDNELKELFEKELPLPRVEPPIDIDPKFDSQNSMSKNFGSLVGIKLSEVREKIGYWWTCTDGGEGRSASFERPGTGRLSVGADKNGVITDVFFLAAGDHFRKLVGVETLSEKYHAEARNELKKAEPPLVVAESAGVKYEAKPVSESPVTENDDLKKNALNNNNSNFLREGSMADKTSAGKVEVQGVNPDKEVVFPEVAGKGAKPSVGLETESKPETTKGGDFKVYYNKIPDPNGPSAFRIGQLSNEDIAKMKIDPKSCDTVDKIQKIADKLGVSLGQDTVSKISVRLANDKSEQFGNVKDAGVPYVKAILATANERVAGHEHYFKNEPKDKDGKPKELEAGGHAVVGTYGNDRQGTVGNVVENKTKDGQGSYYTITTPKAYENEKGEKKNFNVPVYKQEPKMVGLEVPKREPAFNEDGSPKMTQKLFMGDGVFNKKNGEPVMVQATKVVKDEQGNTVKEPKIDPKTGEQVKIQAWEPVQAAVYKKDPETGKTLYDKGKPVVDHLLTKADGSPQYERQKFETPEAAAKHLEKMCVGATMAAMTRELQKFPEFNQSQNVRIGLEADAHKKQNAPEKASTAAVTD